MSSLRWLQTCTTCWPTMDTSWNVEVSSRWRGRERWPLTSSPAAPQVVNERPFDRRVTPTPLIRQRLQRETESGQLEAWCKHSGDSRRPAETRLYVAQMHKWRVLFVLGGCFSPQAAREIMKPSCLRTEVTMLVFMSNSTSISSGVIIYFFVEKNKTVL